MFSGIVRKTVTVNDVFDFSGKRRLNIDLGGAVCGVKIGDSIAINGVCLTVVSINQQQVCFDVVPQTLCNTNLQSLSRGDSVNFELAMCYGDTVGGHLVQGHVDQTIRILEIIETGDAWQVTFELPKILLPFIVEKGFIMLDGMSITIQSLTSETFTVMLIPYTREVTISRSYAVGSQVNVEVDMMAKYVQKIIEGHRCKN